MFHYNNKAPQSLYTKVTQILIMANEEYPEEAPELQKEFDLIELGEKEEEIEEDLEKVKEMFDEEVSTPELAAKKEEPEEEEGGEFDEEFKEISGEEKEKEKPHKHHEEENKDEEDSDEEDPEKEEHPEDEEE